MIASPDSPSSALHVGILGAGKLGITLAKLALRAGYPVSIAGSGPPNEIALTIEVLAPGTSVLSAEDVSAQAELIILALPLGKLASLSPAHLAGKLVIDAMNYWPEVDGERPDLQDPLTFTSEIIQEHLPQSRVIKALNHIGYHDLADEALPSGAESRKAIAVAGNNPSDVAEVSSFIDKIGFDPLPIGQLSRGVQLEPGTPVFGADVPLRTLEHLVAQFPGSPRGDQVLAARSLTTH